MTMQNNQQNQGFIHTAGGQTTILLVALIVIIAIAWNYFW